MKKILISVLSLLLIAVLFVSCGGSGETKESVTESESETETNETLGQQGGEESESESDTETFTADETYSGTEKASGDCGSDMTWSLYDDGTLAIYGHGDMDDYDYVSKKLAPWFGYRSEITSVIIGKNVFNVMFL